MILFTISTGQSVSPAIDLGQGTAVFGLSFPNLRNSVNVRWQVRESAAGTYRFLRPAPSITGASVIGTYTTASSAAGAFFFPDLAPFRHARVVLSASLTSARTFMVFSKS